MEYPKVCLRRGEESGVLKGQRLIYDNELDWADDICTDGCVVDVLDSRQRFAARGFFNSNSRLAVRVLTRDEAERVFCPPDRGGVAHAAGAGLFRFLPRRLR